MNYLISNLFQWLLNTLNAWRELTKQWVQTLKQLTTPFQLILQMLVFSKRRYDSVPMTDLDLVREILLPNLADPLPRFVALIQQIILDRSIALIQEKGLVLATGTTTENIHIPLTDLHIPNLALTLIRELQVIHE